MHRFIFVHYITIKILPFKIVEERVGIRRVIINTRNKYRSLLVDM